MLMVASHAVVIGYVRSRISKLSSLESTTIEVGDFCFQTTADFSTLYKFKLYAVVDPTKLHQGRNRLAQMKIQIREESEQMLRQVDPQWLADPTQTQLRERLMSVVLQYLDEPLVQRVLITDWLQIPISTEATTLVGHSL